VPGIKKDLEYQLFTFAENRALPKPNINIIQQSRSRKEAEKNKREIAKDGIQKRDNCVLGGKSGNNRKRG